MERWADGNNKIDAKKMMWWEWGIVGFGWFVLLVFVIASRTPTQLDVGDKMIIDFVDAENMTGVAKLSCDAISFRVTSFSLSARTGTAIVDSTKCAIIKGDVVGN